MKIKKAERHRKILEELSENEQITISEICELFYVSKNTARRDLRILAQQGLLRRVHGGAVSNLGRSYEPPLQNRSTKNLEAKRVIGRRAAELIFDGDSIAIDVGTTTLELVRCLRNHRNLTIITSSLPIANEIISNFSLANDVRLILTGGIVRDREFSMVGHIAEHAFKEHRVDKAIIGIGGLSVDSGLYEYNVEDTQIKRAMIRSSRQTIVVADSSKLGRTAFSYICQLSDIDILITDKRAPEETTRALRKKGIDVKVVAVDD